MQDEPKLLKMQIFRKLTLSLYKTNHNKCLLVCVKLQMLCSNLHSTCLSFFKISKLRILNQIKLKTKNKNLVRKQTNINTMEAWLLKTGLIKIKLSNYLSPNFKTILISKTRMKIRLRKTINKILERLLDQFLTV